MTASWRGYGRPGVPAPTFLQRIKDTSADYARLSTYLDQLETRAAAVSRITAWTDETAFAYETAVFPHRR
jgi:hypothetical protein